MGLASFAALVYGLVHTFAVRRRGLTAGLATGAILAASPAAQPIYYISLVGGQNPAMFVGHPGRYIGIVAPWAALLLRGRLDERRVLVAVACRDRGARVPERACDGLRRRGARAGLAVAAAAAPAAVAARSLLGTLAALALAAPLITYGLVPRVGDPSPLAFVLLRGRGGGDGGRGPVRARQRPGAARPGVDASRAGLDRVLVLGFLLSNNLVVEARACATCSLNPSHSRRAAEKYPDTAAGRGPARSHRGSALTRYRVQGVRSKGWPLIGVQGIRF